MRQMTLAHQAEFQRYSKKTRREQFLEEMSAVMPWAELLALVSPHYSKGETGRKPVGVEIMLRIYFLQQWFALSDPAVEDALYESPVLRRFAGIDLGRAPAPDETTILNFRHLLEEHDLGGPMLDAVNLYLAGRGIRITTGTIVDATIIHAPSSTKNGIRRAKATNGTSEPRRISASIPEKVLCTLCAPARRAFPMCTCCRIFCTVRKRRYGAMRVIRDRRRRFMRPRPRRRI